MGVTKIYMVNMEILKQIINKNPLLISRLTGVFMLSFFIFFFIHESFMTQIQMQLNFLYETIANASGITNIRPSLLSLLSTTVLYTFYLFIIVSITQSGMWFEAKKSFSVSHKSEYIIFGISLVLGILLVFILGLPLLVSSILSVFIVFSILYMKTIIYVNLRQYLKFFLQYTKVALVSVILYVMLTFLHFMISFIFLQRLGQNPYDVYGPLLYALKWLFHIIVFMYFIYASSYAAKLITATGCKRVSIKKSFTSAFAKKSSYIYSAIMVIYVLVVSIFGYGILLLPNANILNFIFMTIFLLGGFVLFFLYLINIDADKPVFRRKGTHKK